MSTAYQVLARKYRPATFDDLVGQEVLVRTLTNAIALNRIAHAFLLTGIRGIGKTTTARIIARALNCASGPTANPCGVCEHCIAIREDRHPDVLEMDAASRTGVGDIRELIENARYLPTMGRYKIYIIDEVHMLSNSAFNALLKTLEEPPVHVKFIFATTETRKIPVTILSRCQRFDLRRLEGAALAQHLGNIAAKEGVQVEEGALALIARAAEGSVRDALSLLDQSIAQNSSGDTISELTVRDMLGMADRMQLFDLFQHVLEGNSAAALTIFGQLYARGGDPVIILSDVLEISYLLSKIKVTGESLATATLPSSEYQRAQNLAAPLSIPYLARLWQALLKGIQDTRQAPHTFAAAEMLLIRLAYLADLPTPERLIRALQASGGKEALAASVSVQPTVITRSSILEQPIAPVLEQRVEPVVMERSEPKALRSAMTIEFSDDISNNFRKICELFKKNNEPLLYHYLTEDVHVIECAEGACTFRATEGAPPNLAQRVRERLADWTGIAWRVSLAREAGQPTLSEQVKLQQEQQRQQVVEEPLVQAALSLFPQAEVTEIFIEQQDKEETLI